VILSIDDPVRLDGLKKSFEENPDAPYRFRQVVMKVGLPTFIPKQLNLFCMTPNYSSRKPAGKRDPAGRLWGTD